LASCRHCSSGRTPSGSALITQPHRGRKYHPRPQVRRRPCPPALGTVRRQRLAHPERPGPQPGPLDQPPGHGRDADHDQDAADPLPEPARPADPLRPTLAPAPAHPPAMGATVPAGAGPASLRAVPNLTIHHNRCSTHDPPGADVSLPGTTTARPAASAGPTADLPRSAQHAQSARRPPPLHRSTQNQLRRNRHGGSGVNVLRCRTPLQQCKPPNHLAEHQIEHSQGHAPDHRGQDDSHKRTCRSTRITDFPAPTCYGHR